MPMFGMATHENISSNKVTIELKRLFAKVNLTINMDLTESSGYINRAQFVLNTITLSNLPTKVSVVDKSGKVYDSEWVDEDGEDYSIMPNSTIYDFDENNSLGISSAYSCICYIPEIFLLANKTNIYETKKPSCYDSDKFPVFFTIEGDLTHPNYNLDSDGEPVPVQFTYDVYLGENTSDDFNINRNKFYKYTMTIEGIDNVRLELDERAEAEIPVKNLAETESANCYIISEIGRFKLPLVKGNTSESVGTVESVDYSITDNANNEISNYKIDDGYLIFDVNMADMNHVENGNTMLLAKGADDNVLWSWHLWFAASNDRPDEVLERYVDDYGYFNGYYVMNRPLGATSSYGLNLGFLEEFGFDDAGNYGIWTNGLYYQWGRKDPLFINNNTTNGSGGTYQNSISHPNVFYTDWEGDNESAGWSDTKTVNDPCPPGYKVPKGNIWRSSNDDDEKVYGIKMTNEDRYAYNLTSATDGDLPSPFIFYSYSGYYNSSIDDKISSVDEYAYDIANEEYGYCENAKSGDYYLGVPLIFDEIEFRYIVRYSQGAMWEAGSTVPFVYGYTGSVKNGFFSDIEIVRLKYKQATITTTGFIIKKYDKISWPTNFSDPIETSKINSMIQDSDSWRVAIGLLKEYLERNYLLDDSGYLYLPPYDENATAFAASSALQVRCVKE